MSLREKVVSMIAKNLDLNPADISPDAHLIKDLGADSLDVVELVMSFEDEFGIEVPDEDAEKIGTLSDILSYIERRMSEGGAVPNA